MEGTFPTFCHLSDYGREGFENLHRMILAASPLVVWAPTAIELNRGECPLSARDFLKFVDTGHIRVVGRRWWLTEPGARNAQSRPEAQWVRGFDDVLLAMQEEDTRLGNPARARVRIMPPEEGYTFANEQIGQLDEPIKNRRLYNRVLRMYANNLVPIGTAEKAARKAAEVTHRNTKQEAVLRRKTIVREILRDARNHVDAVRMSGASVPFWSIDDGQFIGLLDGNQESFQQEQADVASGSNAYFSDYLKQSLEVLSELERVPGARTNFRDPQQLMRFLGTEQHTQLVEWLQLHTERSRRLDLTDAKIRAEMLVHLREGLSAEFPKRSLTTLFELSDRKAMRLVQSLDVMVTVGALLSSGSDILDWASFGFLTIIVLDRLVFPKQYDGFRWPFFYVFGGEPTPDRLRELRQFLEALQPSRTVHGVRSTGKVRESP